MSVFGFLSFLFVLPFFFPDSYKTITSILFMGFFPLLIGVYVTKNIYGWFHIIFLLFLVSFTLLGMPGTIYGYYLVVVAAIYVARLHVNQWRDSVNSLFNELSLVFLFYCLGTFYLLYFHFEAFLNNDSMAYFFSSIASINYAALVICGFSSIYGTHAALMKNSNKLTTRSILIINIISVIFSIFIVSFVVLSGFRTGVFAILPLLFLMLGTTRYSLVFYFISGILIVGFIFYDSVMDFIAPESGSIFNLVLNELSFDSERPAAMIVTFEYLSFNKLNIINVENFLSFSSLVNFLALFFPLSLYFLYNLIRFSVLLVCSRLEKNLDVVIFVSFLNSFALSMMHPDFYSLMSLFYVTSFYIALNKRTFSSLFTSG
jgi:hypothetical protein